MLGAGRSVASRRCRTGYLDRYIRWLHRPVLDARRPSSARRLPDAALNIEPTEDDGQVNMRMLVKLATVVVKGSEDTDSTPTYGSSEALRVWLRGTGR